MTVRVRFAPSPTGYLHIGGARTALYNWLFARHNSGTFILRIEDTDEVRSTEESVNAILDGLSWLKLDWDDGPYFQAQRLETYNHYVAQLLKEEKAYPCFCTPQDLEMMRQQAMLEKRPPKYDGRCRVLTKEKINQYRAEKRLFTVRFKCPSTGTTAFQDLIREQVVFENALLDDVVLVKSSGFPTYNFAVVIDDHLMEITHVIRGDDHLSNTPRQILVYEALGWQPPVFAHLSMIMGSDGSRLSKRHGATSVTEYREAGFLPEALVNYLTLLGWSTEDSQQLFELPELIQKFAIERCSKSSAIFDPLKLQWMNGEYIRKISHEELLERCLPWLKKSIPFDTMDLSAHRARILEAISLEHEKVKLLSDVPKLIDFLFLDKIEYRPEAVDKTLRQPGTGRLLEELAAKFQALPEFTAASTESATRAFCKEKGVKTGALFHPVRVAVSGRTEGPSLFHMLEFLGKDKVFQRIQNALNLEGVKS